MKSQKNVVKCTILLFATLLIAGCLSEIPTETAEGTHEITDQVSSAHHQACKSRTNEKHGRKCVRNVVHRLGLHKYKRTDPAILADILENDMYLADLPSVQNLFRRELIHSVSIRSMLKEIERSIVRKHPAIVEFLCEALRRDLIPRVDGSDEIIRRIVHHTYLLEVLTVEMANDWQLMVEIQDHLLAKREALGIPSDFMDSVLTLHAVTGQLFEPIKMKTMDWVFVQYQAMRERGYILESENIARQRGTSFNILEAAIAENLNGYSQNAMAGIALAVVPPEELRVVGDNNFIEYQISQEWASLYESWNLAFVTGNISHLHMTYPKLFIPSVINAKPVDYLFNRVLSLWLTINFNFLAQINGKPDYPVPNATELTELWSEINYRHAVKFIRDERGADLSDFNHMLSTTYDSLWEQLKVMLIASGIVTEEEAQQLSDLLAAQ